MVDMQPNHGEQQPNSKRFNGTHKTMFPAKNSHHRLKSTHKKENETINLRIFWCTLNEKKRLTVQSIQNSKFKLPFFISGIISFTIFQILLFSFIYFIPIWEQKQPLRGVPCN